MEENTRPDGKDNPLYRVLHPATVADAAIIRHTIPGRLRLALRRSDQPCLDAVVAALSERGATVERAVGGQTPSIVLRYDPAALTDELLLAAPLPALPLPPARIGAAADVAGPAPAVWAALTVEEGPPWCPPAMLDVVPLEGTPAAWDIAVRVGPWTLPHRMVVTAEEAPHLLELSIAGKLNGLIRYEIVEAGAGATHLSQQLWFAIDGSAAEVTMGEGIVQQFARRFADEQVRDIARRVEQATSV